MVICIQLKTAVDWGGDWRPDSSVFVETTHPNAPRHSSESSSVWSAL